MKKLLLLLYSVSCFSFVPAQQPDSTWVIKNLEINSVDDDYSPFLVDSMMWFTSTRRNNREDKLLEYTEKVYYTLIADTSFGNIEKLSYKINIDANSALVGVSDKNFFLYQSYFPDNGQIFQAIRKQGTHSKSPIKIPYILSDKDENSIATKGDSLYFTSNRNGNYDIFFQTGKEKPIPVDILNSPFDEKGVWISPSGKELYINSNREGRFAIYKSIFLDGEWQVPTKLPFPINMPDWDNIDYRQYNDSIIYFASNRPGGLGGYDIYRAIQPVFILPPDSLRQDSIPPLDSIPKLDTIPKLDSVPKFDSVPDISRQIVPLPPDTLTAREQLLIELKKLELVPFRGEIQLGAYQKFWTTVPLFKGRFDCVDNENIRMDVFEIEGESPLNKFVIDHIYTNLDSALAKQAEVIEGGCLPKDDDSMPFIALLRADKKRYAIFWKKNEYEKKEVLWLKLEGKEIWRGEGKLSK